MAIPIKNDSQIAKMREAGIVVAEVLALLESSVAPGVSTRDLDRIAAEHIHKRGAKSAFKGYFSYPGEICTSVNNEVIHGIPGIKTLKAGDIISIDVGVVLDGFHADAARTFAVGEISPEAQRLIDATKETFYKAIEFAKEGFELLLDGVAKGNLGIPEYHITRREINKLKTVDAYIEFCEKLFFENRDN